MNFSCSNTLIFMLYNERFVQTCDFSLRFRHALRFRYCLDHERNRHLCLLIWLKFFKWANPGLFYCFFGIFQTINYNKYL